MLNASNRQVRFPKHTIGVNLAIPNPSSIVGVVSNHDYVALPLLEGFVTPIIRFLLKKSGLQTPPTNAVILKLTPMVRFPKHTIGVNLRKLSSNIQEFVGAL